jgi:hypothetical protein
MVFTPIVRGMFGVEWNASENLLTVTPSLPPQWNDVKITGVPIGDRRVTLEMRRNGAALLVTVGGDPSKSVKLRTRAPNSSAANGELRIPLPAVEVEIGHGLPVQGRVTSQMKVLDQQNSPRSLRVKLSAPGGSLQTLFLRVNDPKVRPRVEGGELAADSTGLRVQFPSGTGYAEKMVTISW